jgi:hypothetical protein
MAWILFQIVALPFTREAAMTAMPSSDQIDLEQWNSLVSPFILTLWLLAISLYYSTIGSFFQR